MSNTPIAARTSTSRRRQNKARWTWLAGSTAALTLAVAATSAVAQTPAKPATKPVDPYAPQYGPVSREQKITTLMDYLEKEHTKKLSNPYWLSRAMGVITIARVPKPTVTTKLLEVCERDKHDVVRLLAWQGVLSRADQLDAKTHLRFVNATLALSDRDAFRGALRPALLDVLATAPPSAKARRLWTRMLEETNAWEPQDIGTLDALGRTLNVWRSGQLAELTAKLLIDPNHGVRAEYVLKASGLAFQGSRERLKPSVFQGRNPDRDHPSSGDLFKAVQADALGAIQKDKAAWREVTKLSGEPWKALRPLFVPAPPSIDSVDPDDKFWMADLELQPADLASMEAVFVIDATGTMGDVITWLRRDVARVMQAMTAVCKEPPALGVVFYRDKDAGSFVTRLLPLTYKLGDLGPGLMAIQAEGGGDIPEAVQEALKSAVDEQKWNVKAKRTGKVCVLIGDAPPKPGTELECQNIAKRAKEMGIQTYAVKVTNAAAQNDLSVFDQIAEAGGGRSTPVEFQRISNIRFVDPDGRDVPLPTVERPETQLIVAPSSADRSVGEKIFVPVLVDAINPGYRDRVEPLVYTLLAHVAPRSETEKRLGFSANTPPVGAGMFRPQGK
jgi:Mg-chelatase subunit ChlD